MPAGRRALAALALVGILVGCGGGPHYSGVATRPWALTVCEAWNQWQQDTASRLANFRAKTAALTAAPDQKAQLVALFDALRQTSAQMVTTVKDAGHPAVKNGPAVADAFVSTLAAFPPAYADAKTKAGNLPTDDVAKYTQQVQTISAGLNTSLQQISARFGQINRTYHDPKLVAALNQPACKSLSLPSGTTATTVAP